MDEQLRTEFNEWARAGKGESMERGHRPVGEQAIAHMRVEPDSRVLDIGCGSGWASRLLAELAFNGRVTGIDISDEMVRVARQAVAQILTTPHGVQQVICRGAQLETLKRRLRALKLPLELMRFGVRS